MGLVPWKKGRDDGDPSPSTLREKAAWRPRHKAATCKPGRRLPPETNHIGASLSEFQPQNRERIRCYCVSHLVCGGLLWQPTPDTHNADHHWKVGFFSPGDAKGFPGGSDGKESCNAGDLASIPGLGRSPGGGHDHSLQYCCLENPHRQRSLVGYSPRVTNSQTWLSD